MNNNAIKNKLIGAIKNNCSVQQQNNNTFNFCFGKLIVTTMVFKENKIIVENGQTGELVQEFEYDDNANNEDFLSDYFNPKDEHRIKFKNKKLMDKIKNKKINFKKFSEVNNE